MLKIYFGDLAGSAKKPRVIQRIHGTLLMAVAGIFIGFGIHAQSLLSVAIDTTGSAPPGFSVWAVNGAGSNLVTTNLGSVNLALNASTNTNVNLPPAVDQGGTLKADDNSVMIVNGSPLTNTVNFSYGSLYQNFAQPLHGGSLGLQISGLTPVTPYFITFYSFDENTTSNVISWFADYTANTSNFLGSITYNNANNTGLPFSNNEYALTMPVTSDAAGRLTFNETSSCSNPVLNGFVIAAVSNAPIGGHIWDGTVNGKWDIDGTANWKTNAFYTETNNQGPAVVFDDTASGPNTEIILDTTVTPSAVLVSNSILNYTMSGPGGITGTGGLLKQGAGLLTLCTSNSYTGGTIVNHGILALNTTNNNVSMAYSINDGIMKLSLTLPGTSLNTDSLSFSNGSPQLTFELEAASVLSAPAINDQGNLMMNCNVVINVSHPTSGNSVLLAYKTRGGPGNFVVGTLPTGAGIFDDLSDQEIIYMPDTNNPPQQIIKVYLQGGQSNADGRAIPAGLPANLLAQQTDVLIYDGDASIFTYLEPGLSNPFGYFGPEVTFGRTLADFYGQTNHISTNNVMVAIIKYAVGGSSLYSDWAAGGDSSTAGDGPIYTAFQTSVQAGLAQLSAAFPKAIIELDGMIWVQGESDIDLSSGASGYTPTPAASAAYGTNLVNFINDVRLTYATNRPYGTNLPFVISRISTNQTAFSNPVDWWSFPYYLEVRAGQAYAAATLTNTYMLDTDGSQFSVGTIGPLIIGNTYVGNQHYDAGGQQALGIGLAQALIGALPRPQIQSIRPCGNNWRITFGGASGINYSVERATSLLGPWSSLTSIFMGTAGVTFFDDQAAPAAAAFYRISYP